MANASTHISRNTTSPHSASPNRGWLTVADICADLDISRRTWQEWRADGRTPKCRRLPNNSLRISRTDYAAWLDLLPQEVA